MGMIREGLTPRFHAKLHWLKHRYWISSKSLKSPDMLHYARSCCAIHTHTPTLTNTQTTSRVTRIRNCSAACGGGTQLPCMCTTRASHVWPCLGPSSGNSSVQLHLLSAAFDSADIIIKHCL